MTLETHPEGIGSTLRVSLTLPFAKKAGRFCDKKYQDDGYNITSCPSCSRVENEKFINLAQSVKELTENMEEKKMTVAVMGCRVNGHGETDDANFGLWCGPKKVNLKKSEETISTYSYYVIIPKMNKEIQIFK